MNELSWAVVTTCTAKNDGKIETFKRVVGLFTYPFLAQDYIDKCLPKENDFEVVHTDKLEMAVK